MNEFPRTRTFLCFYECMRLAFLMGIIALLRSEGMMPFPWLAAPGALFLLMTIFLRLDIGRYLVYIPLYIAGKGLSTASTIFWFFWVKSYIMEGLFFDNDTVFKVAGIVFFLLLGDILSVLLARVIMRKVKCE